jgi:hypothetical protein
MRMTSGLSQMMAGGGKLKAKGSTSASRRQVSKKDRRKARKRSRR